VLNYIKARKREGIPSQFSQLIKQVLDGKEDA